MKEIALMDMTTEDEENETLVMDNTKISDIIKPGCLELEYVYDFFSNKYFKVEYAGEYIRDSSDVMPVCVWLARVIFRNSSLTRMGTLTGSLTSRRKEYEGIMTIVSWKSSATGIMMTRIAKTEVVMTSTIVTNATRVWMII